MAPVADDGRVSAGRVSADALAVASARADCRRAGALTMRGDSGYRRPRSDGAHALTAAGEARPVERIERVLARRALARLNLGLAALRQLHAAPARGAALVQRDYGLAKLGLDRAAAALPVAGDRVRPLRDAVAVPAAAFAACRRRALLHGDQLVRLVVRRPRAHSIDTTRMSNFRLLPASGWLKSRTTTSSLTSCTRIGPS